MKKLSSCLMLVSLFAARYVDATANHIKKIINNSPYCVKLSTTAKKVEDIFKNPVFGTNDSFVVAANQTVTLAKSFQTLNPKYSDENPGLSIDVTTPYGVKTSVLTNDGRASFLTNSASGPIPANTDINLVIDSSGNVTQVPA